MDHARQGIRGIERAFRNALNLRNDPEFHRSNYGVLVNNTLWRADYKIINVFSDGLPNHMVSGRNHPDEKYIGEAAVRDACFQIRKLRRQGVHVIGIFLGSDSELENERILYGTSFLCIRQ